MISNDEGIVNNEVWRLVEERTGRILERFRQVAVSNVKNPDFLAALEDVKSYWKDISRPALTSFACEAVGGAAKLAESAGVMFALASAGFGIHDDILDLSENKHLRMTILGLHGVDIALLLGDILIGKAWTVVKDLMMENDNVSKVANILEIYGNLCIEVCEAELMETQCRCNVDIDLEYYENILWKAMAETEACSRIGGILGDGKKNEVEVLAEIGRRIGFMSRLADDIEDCLNVKGDLIHRVKNESLPLPLLYAAKFSAEKRSKIKNIVEKPHISPLDVKLLLQFCFETEAFEYVHNVAKKSEEETSRLLHLLKVSQARSVLLLIVKKSYDRICDLCI